MGEKAKNFGAAACILSSILLYYILICWVFCIQGLVDPAAPCRGGGRFLLQRERKYFVYI